VKCRNVAAVFFEKPKPPRSGTAGIMTGKAPFVTIFVRREMMGVWALDKRHWPALLVFILFIVLTAGCQSRSNAENAIYFMEKSAAAETGFNKVQPSLVAAEKREHQLFEAIMQTEPSQKGDIRSRCEKALEAVGDRERIIEKEKKSIDRSYALFKKAIPYLKEVKDGQGKARAESMIRHMENRYRAFQALYAYYKESVQTDRKLFQLLKADHLTFDDLERQVVKADDLYKKIKMEKDLFNQHTKAFNDEKRRFHQTLGQGG